MSLDNQQNGEEENDTVMTNAPETVKSEENEPNGEAQSTGEKTNGKVDVKLEDLFNDEDDDDDEFPTSSAVQSKVESSPQPAIEYAHCPFTLRGAREKSC